MGLAQARRSQERCGGGGGALKPLWFVLALAVLWVVSVALVNGVWAYLRRRERDAFKRPRR